MLTMDGLSNVVAVVVVVGWSQSMKDSQVKLLSKVAAEICGN